MTYKLKPKQNYLLIREIKEVENDFFKTPDSVRVSLQKATVIDVSDSVTGYTPGDTIIYNKANGYEYEDLKLILSNDIIGTLK